MSASAAITSPRLPQATLEPVRFGEFLRDRHFITDEQWIAALADHWSAPKRRRIGQTIIDCGFLAADIVEAQARAFHDELDIVEIEPGSDETHLARSERTTLPVVPVTVALPAF